MSEEPQRRNGMANASLACGLFVCIPLAGIFAIIFGILGLKKSRDSRFGGNGTAIAGIVLGIIGVLMTPFVISTLLVPIRLQSRVRSSNNEKQIGLAIVLYCNQNQGRYPPDLGTLFKTQTLSITDFVYPTPFIILWGGTPPLSNVSEITPDQQAQWVSGHSDYVYIGAGLTSASDPNKLVLYENDEVHDVRGTNVLFADGHVECLAQEYVHNQIERQKSKSSANGDKKGGGSSPSSIPRQ